MTGWPEAAEFLGEAYLRYSFTRGTEQEVDSLVDTLTLRPGMRVLDVGCGPGRHARALAARQIDAVGVDLSAPFVSLAAGAGVAAAVGDARRLPVVSGGFDAAWSLCQGGFGVLGPNGGDHLVLAEMARAVRPGGAVVVSAFSAYFQVRHLEASDRFDAGTGVNVESTTLRNTEGDERPMELSTTCFTPKELRLLFAGAGLAVEHLWSVTPGAYTASPPSVETPEYLVVGRRA